MSELIRVPDIGSGEGEVIELFVKVGDTVEADQSILTLESDKASMEIPSPESGKVRELKIKLGDKQVIFIWAVVVGALGALMALVFEMGVELVQDVLTGRTSYRQIQVFQEMASQDPAWCIFVPAAGGLLAGLTLLFTHRFVPAKATEYMEAVALGNGYVPPKPSLLRSLSAVFSVGSGASIGREGPLVQAAAESDVEQLRAAADAQYRQPAV